MASVVRLMESASSWVRWPVEVPTAVPSLLTVEQLTRNSGKMRAAASSRARMKRLIVHLPAGG